MALADRITDGIHLKGDAEFHYENGTTTASFHEVEIDKGVMRELKGRTDMTFMERLRQNPAPEISFDETGKATLSLGTHQVNLNAQEQSALNNVLTGTNKLYVEQNIHTLQKNSADKIFQDFQIDPKPIVESVTPQQVIVEAPVKMNDDGKAMLLDRVADKGDAKSAEITIVMKRERGDAGGKVMLNAVLGDDTSMRKTAIPLNNTEKKELMKFAGAYIAEKNKEAQAEKMQAREEEMQKEAEIYQAYKNINGREEEAFKEVLSEKLGIAPEEIEQAKSVSGYGTGIEGLRNTHHYYQFATEKGTFEVSTLPAHINHQHRSDNFRAEKDAEKIGIFYVNQVNARDERSESFKEDLKNNSSQERTEKPSRQSDLVLD